VSLASLAYLAAPASVSASPGVVHPVTGAKTPKTAQYHGLEGRQYHGHGLSFESDSRSLHESRSPKGELENTISPSVISPVFASDSPRSMAKLLISDHSQFDTRIGVLNGSQIGSQKSHDRSLMLQIGAALGFVYVGFLATWFWSILLWRRPPRDAHR